MERQIAAREFWKNKERGGKTGTEKRKVKENLVQCCNFIGEIQRV